MDRLRLFFLVSLVIFSTVISECHAWIEERVCIGTQGRMSVPSNREHHYQNLRDRYTNCTYVDGNLELTWLQDKNMDLGFLQDIREVTGYVLISHVDVKRIVIPNLQIIRGRTLFKLNVRDEEFALMVTLSKMENLEMPALRDILAGSVGFFNNYNLCHIRTINWEEILTGPKSKTIYVYNFTQPERECPPCDNSCEEGCWGEGPHNCQRFSKTNCSPQCHQGRCFGPNPRECCHLFCAGGCTGPKQGDCLACRNFHDDGVCKQECPPMMKYNPSSYSWEINPEGKYAYGATCVKQCPDHLLKDNGACVRSCPPNKKNNNRGECVPCDGPCPKNCQGVDVVHASNIDSFKECTIIEGSLTILDTSFEGFQEVYSNFSFGPRHPPMHPDQMEVFSTLKQVTGYISIQATHPDFTNLSYFRNLEEIGGRQLTEYFSALYIVKTSLISLNLHSLKSVRSGSVAILENKDLCFANTVEWSKVRKSTSTTHNNIIRKNAEESKCREKNLVCHPECSDGCWGPGPAQCLSCRSYSLGETCVDNCNTSQGIYDAGNRICKHCHEECLGKCSGPGASSCTKCKHVRDGPFCVKECPNSKYNDNGECKPCHENCMGGCTGPKNTLGADGCSACEKAIVATYDPNVVEQCLKGDEPCPDGFYHEYVLPQVEGVLKSPTGMSVCRKCHSRCKNCTAFGIHVSVCECLRYSSGEQCEDQCPRDHYADESNHHCVKCSEECRGCTGPSASSCIACRNYRVYDDNDSSSHRRFNCTASCPYEKPYKVFEASISMDDPYCSDKEPSASTTYNENEDQFSALIASIVATIFIFILFLTIFSYQWFRRAKSKEKTLRLTMKMTGFDDNEPLKVTNIEPNLSKLVVVKEQDLRKGGILGYGAFGTVYKGMWVISGQKKKIPVAIKVLREESQCSMNDQLFQEAYIMASVNHPNLNRLLAICMTSQLMLVTQLMPLGNLLDYVRNNRSKIGSKPLLNWCTQIARGMAYLEEKRMVHRDLALRNVLLQNPGYVRITDFGLAKFLDINEDEYKADGGKLPIKWLAPECIQKRIFTHKSDVWAFGVTLWELFTYGKKPYEDDNVRAKEVLGFLLSGERLKQPAICTIEVYMIMLRCWVADVESRPSFKDMADQFSKWARDPGRYLVIPGDEFMRLPIFSPQDQRELLTGALGGIGGATDGDEEIVDAEEYFQLNGHAHHTDSPPPPTPIKKFMEDRGFDGEPLPSTTQFMTEQQVADAHMRNSLFMNSMQRNGQNPYEQYSSASYMPQYDGSMMMGHHYAGSHIRDGSMASGRFSTNPMGTIMRDADGNEVFVQQDMSTMSKRMALRLPVDEDDYLLPSPQHMGNSVAYMDLIGDGKGSDHHDGISHQGFSQGFDPTGVSRVGLDNLEYHMMSSNYGMGTGVHYVHTSQRNNLPTVSGSNVASTSGVIILPNNHGSSLQQQPPPSSLHHQHHHLPVGPSHAVPQMGTQIVHIVGGRKLSSNDPSDEGSDDHDYYNDYQRELQPLQHRRNETTV